MHLTFFDIGVLVVVLFSTVSGFTRRFSGEALGVLAWVTAGSGVLFLSGFMAASPVFRAEVFGGVFSPYWLRYFVSCSVIFFSAHLSVHFLGHRIGLLLRPDSMSRAGGVLFFWDRVLGIAYGLLRGFVFCSLIYWAVVWVTPNPDSWPDWISASRVRPVLAVGRTYLEDAANRLYRSDFVRVIFSDYIAPVDREMAEDAKREGLVRRNSSGAHLKSEGGA